MRILELLSDVRVLAVLAVVGTLLWNIRIIKQYERGILFRLGRCRGVKEPGLTVLIPFVDDLLVLDLRVLSIDVARQDTMSRDNVPVTVDAVVYMRIIDPERAVLSVEDAQQSTYLIAQTSLRSVIGETSLDELLGARETVNGRLKELIDRQVIAWGVDVPIVEIKEVSLPETMKRAMAMEAESERERRARLIKAEGEVQASNRLIEAARILGSDPHGMQLRYLQALNEVSSERSTFVVFPLPVDRLGSLLGSPEVAPASANGGAPAAAIAATASATADDDGGTPASDAPVEGT